MDVSPSAVRPAVLLCEFEQPLPRAENLLAGQLWNGLQQ